MALPRLGVNIDHVATLRQLRGTPYPSLLEAARIAEKAGAEQITVHLREDRRHIQDEDVHQLRGELKIPLNLEMANSDEIVKIAIRVRPDWACLVPEKRREVTTEGGLDLDRNFKTVGKTIDRLKNAGIRVSCFVEPTPKSVRLCRNLGADAVELHTGAYCIATQSGGSPRAQKRAKAELEKIRKAANAARASGLHCHVGHGLDYENVRPIAAFTDIGGEPLIEEYNIGHSIICRSALVGLERAVREMVSAIHAP